MEPKSRWHNGHSYQAYNFTDNVTCSETWLEGATALLEDLREYGKADDDQAVAADLPATMSIDVELSLLDRPPSDGNNIGYLIRDHRLRTISFWLVRVVCDGPH